MTSLEFLSEKYGNQGYKGFFYLNSILEKSVEGNMPNVMLKHFFIELASEYKTNPVSIERNLRTFKNKVGYKDVLKNFIFENILEYTSKK